jgi:hypothetical protein
MSNISTQSSKYQLYHKIFLLNKSTIFPDEIKKIIHTYCDFKNTWIMIKKNNEEIAYLKECADEEYLRFVKYDYW